VTGLLCFLEGFSHSSRRIAIEGIRMFLKIKDVLMLLLFSLVRVSVLFFSYSKLLFTLISLISYQIAIAFNVSIKVLFFFVSLVFSAIFVQFSLVAF
jgi:hypothetical protein